MPVISHEVSALQNTTQLHSLIPPKNMILYHFYFHYHDDSCYLETLRKPGQEKSPNRMVFPEESHRCLKVPKNKAGVQQDPTYNAYNSKHLAGKYGI